MKSNGYHRVCNFQWVGSVGEPLINYAVQKYIPANWAFGTT